MLLRAVSFVILLSLLAVSAPAEARDKAMDRLRDSAMTLVEGGKYADGYRQVASVGKFEAQFLAGWISLRRLNNPKQALQHFQRMAGVAGAPTEKASAGYWAGRALEAMGRQGDAKLFFRAASAYGYTFYGQVAATKLGVKPIIATDPRAAFSRPELDAAISSAEAKQAIAAGKAGNAEARLSSLLSLGGQDPKSMAIAGSIALAIDAPDAAVLLSRRSEEIGVPLIEIGYPVLKMAWHDKRVESELVLSVIREESNFKQTARSGKAAQGSMQVMDDTAKHVGRLAGIPIDLGMMRSNRDYNIAVGSYYLGNMLEEYGNSFLLAIAAYNAGPRRVDNWLSRFGDPRSGADPIDWVESIPYWETRGYVKKVMSTYITYLAETRHR